VAVAPTTVRVAVLSSSLTPLPLATSELGPSVRNLVGELDLFDQRPVLIDVEDNGRALSVLGTNGRLVARTCSRNSAAMARKAESG
jgi:hypothetical protein